MTGGLAMAIFWLVVGVAGFAEAIYLMRKYGILPGQRSTRTGDEDKENDDE